jgi:hypothetical protein
MPGDIGWIPLDRNSRWTAAKAAKEFGKRIMIPDEDLIRMDKETVMRVARLPVAEAIKVYRKHVDKIKELFFRLLETKSIKSICLDTGGALWEDIMFANFGRNLRIMPRDRGAPNQEMRDLINACDKNLLIVHQSKEIWEGSGDNSKPTGEFAAQGFPHMNYCCNCAVEHFKITKANVIRKRLGLDAEDTVPPVLFGMEIYDSQANPMLAKNEEESRLYGANCTFQELAVKVFPSSSSDDWE